MRILEHGRWKSFALKGMMFKRLRARIFIRHGETDGNNERRFQGNPDTPLNANGIAPAGQLAMRIAGEKLDALYASPCPRVKLLNDTYDLRNGHHLGEMP